MTPICATFSEFRLVKGRKVYQIVCELPFEQADAALAALGGLPNPHAERWVGIVALKEQPQGKHNSGSAPPVADAADSPAAAQDGGRTAPCTSASTTPQAQARGAAEPATTPGSSSGRTAEFGSANGGSNPSPGTKPKKRWEDYSPSQQAGMACGWLEFSNWILSTGPVIRWDKDCVADTYAFDDAADCVRWYCGVSSRSELDTDPDAAKRWRELFGMFQADTQYGDRR